MKKSELFRNLASKKNILKIIGTPTPLCAILAENMNAKAIYLSGASVSNFLHGVTDTGLVSMKDVLEAAQSITQKSKLPLLVDIDTGFNDLSGVISRMTKINVAAVHIEDQNIQFKRCGHLQGKKVVSKSEMCERVNYAFTSIPDDKDLVIMARTDAYAIEGLNKTIERAKSYIEHGAEMIFVESLKTLDEYTLFCKELGPVPVLANITEFGCTPLIKDSALERAGVSMALYPRSVERTMMYAAEKMINEIEMYGSQKSLLNKMMDRQRTNELLNYSASVIN